MAQLTDAMPMSTRVAVHPQSPVFSRGRIVRFILMALLILYAILSFYPLFFAFTSSFKSDQQIFTAPFELPDTFSFDNYVRAWNTSRLYQYFLNSVILAVSSCILLIVLGAMAGYALTKFEFRLKGTFYLFFIVGLMIPAQSIIIPMAFNVGRLGIRDSLPLVVMIITAFQLPITVLIFTGFMRGIPGELEEAAMIDGCTPLQLFVRIILPLSAPAIVTVTILNFLAAWNNVLFPLVFLTSDSVKPISIGMLGFFATRTSDYSGMMAAIVMTFLPPLLVYIIAQEQVENGLTAGALKG